MKDDTLFWALCDMDEALILEAKEAQIMKPKTLKSLRIALIAAAVAVLLAGTVLAATYKLWSPGLADWFGAEADAQEALLENGMTSMVCGEPITLENGLTIEVQQILCDGQETTVAVYYRAPEAGWFTRDNRMWASQYTFPTLTIGETAFVCSISGFDRNTVTETTAYMTCSFLGDCSDLDGEAVTLTLQAPPNLPEMLDHFASSFDTANGAEDEEMIRNDPLILWEPVTFSWTLDMSATISKALEGRFSATYDGTVLTCEDVTLTPVSIRFTVTAGSNLLDELYPTGIVLTDGTEIGFHSGGMDAVDLSNGAQKPDSLSGYYTFETVIMDLDSVAGVTFAAWANTPVDPEMGDITVFTLPLQ